MIKWLLSTVLFSFVFCASDLKSKIFRYPCKTSDHILIEYGDSLQFEGKGEYWLHIDVTSYEDILDLITVKIEEYGDVNYDMASGIGQLYSTIGEDGFSNSAVISNIRNGLNDLLIHVTWAQEIPNLLSVNIDGKETCEKPDYDLWADLKAKTETEIIELPTQKPQISVAPTKTLGKCGKVFVKSSPLILNGQDTAPGDWPWHVALYKITYEEHGSRYICGGTLVSKLLVVTAAHCVTAGSSPVAASTILVSLGRYKLVGGSDNQPQEIDVSRIIIRKDFVAPPENILNDIALLTLMREVIYNTYVQPACIWDFGDNRKQEIFNKVSTLAGWGFDRSFALSNTLQKANLPIIDDNNCQKTYPSFYKHVLRESTFCAGFQNGTTACNGDSGGGLMIAQTHQVLNEPPIKIWYLRGVVSQSVKDEETNRCDPHYFVVFTDVARYLDWIREYM